MASFSLAAPQILEYDHSSVTIVWTAANETTSYELQMMVMGDCGEWLTLSKSLQSNMIKKKNLVPSEEYRFRYRYLVGESWSEFSHESAAVSVLQSSINIMNPPKLTAKDGVSVTMAWPDVSGASGYSLRFRSEKDISLRKKGLVEGVQYFFSIKPVTESTTSEHEYAYSTSSEACEVSSLSPFFEKFIPNTLLCRTAPGTISLREAVAGKIVGVYFSAHWCGPCRNFTPKLASLYREFKASNKEIEIIFCSADHNLTEFKSYYETNMPWLAIPFDDEKREEIMGMFNVSGIPKLTILAPSGRIIEDNAASQILSSATVDSWIAKAKTLL